jgi:hypothetical protein
MSDLELLAGYFTTPCNKCKGDVAVNDDAIALLVLETGDRMNGLAISRHLLPVKDGDAIVCEGSPSRAQYLPGQLLDTRPGYEYRPENEASMRELYNRLQKVAAQLEPAES